MTTRSESGRGIRQRLDFHPENNRIVWKPPIPITFCITDLDPGGAERALWQLCRRLDRSFWQPRVICLGPTGEVAQWLLADGIPTECLGLRGMRDIVRIRGLIRHLQQTRPAILQTFLFHANVLGRLAARRAGIEHVVAGIRVAEHRGRCRHWVDGWTDRWVDCHVCVSQSVADFTHRQTGIDQSRLVVIPNGVDVPQLQSVAAAESQPWQIGTDSQVMLFVGRLDEQKAPQDFASTFDRLAPSYPSLQAVMVGTGPLLAQLESWRSQNPNGERIHLLGYRPDAVRIMKASSLLVLPSRWEGFPNTLLEAMAVGLPVVATQAEGCRELIGRDERGWLCPVGDVVRLAAAADAALSAPDTARERAKAAQTHVAQHFTWETAVAAYDRLYRQLLD